VKQKENRRDKKKERKKEDKFWRMMNKEWKEEEEQSNKEREGGRKRSGWFAMNEGKQHIMLHQPFARPKLQTKIKKGKQYIWLVV